MLYIQVHFYGSHTFPCRSLLLSTTVLNDRDVWVEGSAIRAGLKKYMHILTSMGHVDSYADIRKQLALNGIIKFIDNMLLVLQHPFCDFQHRFYDFPFCK